MAIDRKKEQEKRCRKLFSENIEKLTGEEKAELKYVERMELYYLTKYYHFLKYTETEMLDGFKTKEKIYDDWIKYWGTDKSEPSDFAVGAERIVYALLNGKGIGKPNSCPVGSDLMFELEDVFVHIDLKSVGTDNIGDYRDSIFVGENQNSYDGQIITSKRRENYAPHLPYEYVVVEKNGSKTKKLCLSYFVTILYDKEKLDTICISLLCMPNGKLKKVYENAPLKAGKNPGKARFDFHKVRYFEMMSTAEKQYPRIKVIYLNEDRIAKSTYKDDLDFLKELYNSPENDLSFNL